MDAGLGVKGKNRLLINKDYGSWFFISEIVTTLRLPAAEIKEAECLGCGKCISACPTHALSESGFNKELCLSDITQRKGELTPEQKKIIKETGCAWGCDICQEVCPYNRNLPDTPIPFFHTQRISHLTLERLDAMDKATFRSYAFAWRGRSVIRRNLLLFENPPKKESST